MLEAAVNDRLLELGAQNHVLEGGGVDTDVVSGWLGGTSGVGGGSSTSSGGGLLIKVDLDLLVVGELVVVRGLGFYHSIANLVKSLKKDDFVAFEKLSQPGNTLAVAPKRATHCRVAGSLPLLQAITQPLLPRRVGTLKSHS